MSSDRSPRRRTLNLGPAVTGRVQTGIHLSPYVLTHMDEAAQKYGGRSNAIARALETLEQADAETRQVLIEREVHGGRAPHRRDSSLQRINVRLHQADIRRLHQLLTEYRQLKPSHDVEQAHVFRAAVNYWLTR